MTARGFHLVPLTFDTVETTPLPRGSLWARVWRRRMAKPAERPVAFPYPVAVVAAAFCEEFPEDPLDELPTLDELDAGGEGDDMDDDDLPRRLEAPHLAIVEDEASITRAGRRGGIHGARSPVAADPEAPSEVPPWLTLARAALSLEAPGVAVSLHQLTVAAWKLAPERFGMGEHPDSAAVLRALTGRGGAVRRRLIERLANTQCFRLTERGAALARGIPAEKL